MPEFPTVAAHLHRVFSTGFYPSADFDYQVRGLLGSVAYGGAETGEILATIDRVADNDHEHWFRAWSETADRIHAEAETASAAGHMVTAAQKYLRAANYFAVAVDAVSGLGDDTALLFAFRSHRSCWDAFVDTTDRIVERVQIPYETTALPGYFFAPSWEAAARPTLVMVNGSDGAISTLWSSGAAGALARGYNVLVFDGPGQQSMLFERGIGFRPDWEAVLTPVVDFLLARSDVDADRLALYGISQGGFWIARALTREHRFAAAIADPGVVEVASSWAANIPGSLMKLFRAGKKDSFDREMALGMKFSPKTARTWRFRARPYRQEGYFDTLTEVHRYVLSEADLRSITTPLLLTDPEDEQFWPGQSRRLADHAGPAATLADFTAAEGANFHCQPLARQLTDERMFDWLDECLAR